MKIGIVSTWNAKCGLCTYTSYLAEELRNLGTDVIILAETLDIGLEGHKDENFDDKEFKSVVCWRRGESLEHLFDTILELKLDGVIIQHQYMLFQDGQDYAKFLKSCKSLDIKTIQIMHDVVPYDALAQSYHDYMKGATKMVVHQELGKKMLVEQWKFDSDSVVVIPHGTKVLTLLPDKKESRLSLNIPEDKFVLLSWGFLWESKGVEMTLNALSVLQPSVRDKIVFIHAGGLHPFFKRSDYLRKLLVHAKKLGFTPQTFRIVGDYIAENDVPKYFSVADCGIANYYRGSNSASGAVHRMIGAGLPIIMTEDWCLSEFTHMLNCYKVPQGDVSKMAGAIWFMMNNRELRDDIIVGAENYALKTGWASTALRFVELFN